MPGTKIDAGTSINPTNEKNPHNIFINDPDTDMLRFISIPECLKFQDYDELSDQLRSVDVLLNGMKQKHFCAPVDYDNLPDAESEALEKANDYKFTMYVEDGAVYPDKIHNRVVTFTPGPTVRFVYDIDSFIVKRLIDTLRICVGSGKSEMIAPGNSLGHNWTTGFYVKDPDNATELRFVQTDDISSKMFMRQLQKREDLRSMKLTGLL